MNRVFTVILTLLLLAIGVVTVYSYPLNITAISLGMFLIGISILSIAIHIYFPPQRKEVIIRVVESKKVQKRPVKRRRKVKKRRKKKKR